jgi:hypothetical protein
MLMYSWYTGFAFQKCCEIGFEGIKDEARRKLLHGTMKGLK